MNSGLSADLALDHIYTSYGRKNTMTKILNEMSKDCRSGRLPYLTRI